MSITFVSEAAGEGGCGGVVKVQNLPAGWAANDILIWTVETNLETPATPAGWTLAPNSPISGADTRLTVWYRRAVAGDTGADIGGGLTTHYASGVSAWRGCILTGSPFNTSASASAAASTSVSIPGATTTVSGCMVLALVATGYDISSSETVFGSWANGDLTSVAQRGTGWTAECDGGGAALASGLKAAAGAYGATTATLLHSAAQALLTLALIPEPTTPTTACDGPLSFDVYSLGTATTPALTYLTTICDAFDKGFRIEKDGTGSGKFSINRSSADATAAILGDGDGDVRFIKARIPGIDANPLHGFFLQEGDFRLLDEDEDGGETLTFSGHGSLGYLDFARMLAHSYITGGMDPFTGLWRLYLAGTGSKPGQMLGRAIEEAQDTDRPQKPLPLLTDTFDYTNDSNGAAWASSAATNEFSAQIGESVLSVVGRLIGTGAITVQMSPALVLSAYNTFGTNRSSATYAAGKVRFVGGDNIAVGLTRQVRPTRVATHALVYGEEETSVVSALADAASRVTREAFLSASGTDTTALTAVGAADLAERLLRSESVSFRIALGADDATGLYLPGPAGSTAGKFWVGDTVTLHTGTGEFDFANQSIVVAAINFEEGDAAVAVTDLAVTVELGSMALPPAAGSVSGGSVGLTPGTLSASPGGGSSTVPVHSHPSSVTTSAWKAPVRAALTGSINLSAPGATIDGVTMALQDRFLAPVQTAGAGNGIYVWLGAAVAASRAPDFASGTTALGAVVYVTEGTINADRAFMCTTNETITLGTTALTFERTSLLPHGGGEDTVYAHGSMGATETFDPASGNWHTGTFNAACTFTFTAPRDGKGCTLFLELAQDGTGGWAVTLPASFTNKAALEAAQITTASTTAFLIAWTRNGGVNWHGAWAGSAGVTYATPAIVLGTAAAAGAATTVIRSDSTIVAFDATVPVTQAFSDAAATGSAAVAARRDHRHGMPATPTGGQHILLADGRPTPFAFTDLLQMDDGSDFMWSDP